MEVSKNVHIIISFACKFLHSSIYRQYIHLTRFNLYFAVLRPVISDECSREFQESQSCPAVLATLS